MTNLKVFKNEKIVTLRQRLADVIEHAEENCYIDEECSSVIVVFNMNEGPGYYIKSSDTDASDIGMLELTKMSISLRYMEGADDE